MPLGKNKGDSMFRDMRRKKQLLTEEKTVEILQRGTAGTLALMGDGGYTYSLPISYVYDAGKIYFHCANAGHKLDAIEKHDKVSFSVIDENVVVPEEYTTYFRSAVVFGKIRVIREEAEKRRTLEILAAKFSPDHEEGRRKEIDDQLAQVTMLELTIDHMSGKEAIELVKKADRE